MRILHTSDWHLGRALEGRSRLAEQRDFIMEIKDIAEKERVDLILIAGDVFDTSNPSAAAEQLFYEGIYELSAGGRRGVVVIAGNHDNPERIKASDPLAEQLGITLWGLPKDLPLVSGLTSDRVKRVAVGLGWLELAVPGCDHSAVVVALPYPSEQRLKELLTDQLQQEMELQKSFSQRVGAFFAHAAQHYRPDTVNLCVSHLFVAGGMTSESERPIDVGGTYLVKPAMLPAQSQYIALGHLHRPQRVAQQDHIRYSGSPLCYSFSEAGQAKAVYLVDCQPGQRAEVQEIYLTSGHPLVRWQVKKGLDEAIKLCESSQDHNAWIDLTLHVPEPLQAEEIKLLRTLRPKIINIRPVLPEMERLMTLEGRERLPVDQLFSQFYQHHYGVPPNEELVKLFLELLQQDKEGEGA